MKELRNFRKKYVVRINLKQSLINFKLWDIVKIVKRYN